MDKNAQAYFEIEELKRQITSLRVLQDTAPVGLLVVDRQTNKIQYFNEAFLQIWGIGHLKGPISQGELKIEDMITYLLSLASDPQGLVDLYRDIQKRDDAVISNYIIRMADGRYVCLNSSLIMNYGSQNQGRVYTFEDVTRSIKAEEEARKSNERYKDLADLLPQIVFEMNLEGTLTFVNRSAYEAMGYTDEEFRRGLNVLGMIVPGEREMARRNIERVLKGDKSGQEYTFQRKDGSRFPVIIHSTIIHRDGKPAGLRGFIVDITEQKASEDRLRRLSAAIEQSPSSVMIFDPEGKIVYVNPQFSRITGYSGEEAIGKSLFSLSFANARPEQLDEVMGAIRSGQEWRGEIEYKAKHGRPSWVSAHIFPIKDTNGKITHFIDAEEDITERKEAEEKLLLTQTSIDNFTDSCIWMDMNLDILYVNDATCRSLGYTREELLGMNIKDIDPLFSEEFVGEITAAMVKNGFYRFESFRKTRDGGLFPVDISCKFYRQGNKAHIISFERDITERKQAEKKLSDNLHFLQVLLDAIPVPVYYKDVQERYIGCNDAFEKYLGRSREEIIGRNAYDINPKELADIYHQADMTLLDSGDDQLFESKVRHADGNYRDVIFYKAVFQGTDGKLGGIIGTILDITDRKLTEERIKSSLKEKEVLLKEVHHRVKNNMQIISSLLNLQLSGIDQEPVKQILAESQSRIRSIALVHERMYMSNDLSKIDFDEYLKSLGNQLLVTYRANSGRVRLIIEGADIHLGVDQAVPCGLIMNELISNSLKHAFPESRPGTIKIQLSCSDHNKITIEDDGIGMPEGFSLAYIQSMGMQLVSALVEQLEGTITLDRSFGSRFTITFPVR